MMRLCFQKLGREAVRPILESKYAEIWMPEMDCPMEFFYIF